MSPPDSTQPSATATASPPASKRRGVLPSDLIPEARGLAVEKTYRIWTGMTDDAPRSAIELAGVSFPKLNGELQRDESLDNSEVQRTVRGSMNDVTATHLREIKSAIKRTLFRFYGGEVEVGLEDEPGSGRRHKHRNNQIVKIPREKDIKAAEKAGNPAHRYRPNPNDVPVAKYCYLKFVANREHTIPPTCAEVGFIDVPEDLEI